MKSIFFLILSLNALAFNYTGDLFDSEKNYIGACFVKVEKKQILEDHFKIVKLEYLDKFLTDINFRFFIKNSINGKLFLSKNPSRIVLNTNRDNYIVAIDLYLDHEHYKCTINEK